MLNYFNCANDAKIEIKHFGECLAPCPVCDPFDITPVCASDDETYMNECYLRKYNCNMPTSEQIFKQNDGECEIFHACHSICPPLWEPGLYRNSWFRGTCKLNCHFCSLWKRWFDTQ